MTNRRAFSRRRLLLGLSASAVVAGLAAACGQTQGGQPAAKPAPTTATKPAAAAAPKAQAGGQQKTTNVWFNQATQLENFKKNVVERYHNSQNQYRLDVVMVPNTDLTTKLTAAIAGGEPPDAVRIGGPELNAVFYRKGAATAIDELDSKIQTYDFVPAIKDALTWNGKMWAMPSNSGTMALYYNAELYERAGLDPDDPPATFAAMIDAAKKIKSLGGGIWGQEFATKPNTTTSTLAHAYRLGFNGPDVSPDGKTVLFDSPENVEFLTWYKTSVVDSGIMPIKLMDETTMTNEFGTGNIGQYGAYPSRLENAVQSLESAARTARLPAGPKANSLPIGFGTLMIPAKAKNRDGGWHFVNFIGNDPENDSVWCTAFGQLPPRLSFRDSQTYTAYRRQRPQVEAFLKGQEGAVAPYYGPAVGQIWTAYAKAIEAVTFGAKSPEQAAKDATKEAQTALDGELAAGAEPLVRTKQ